MDSATRQVEQRKRREGWEAEGHEEWCQQLETMLQPLQQSRFNWLKQECKGTVLELGCNWGYVLGFVGGDAGIDVSRTSIDTARKLAREKTFFCMDITQEMPPLYYDTIIIPDVLEHIPFEKVSKVIEWAKQNAQKRVLITIPQGDEDTVEATNMKHQWLCDRDHARTITTYLDGVPPLSDGTFLYWKWVR